MTANIRYLLLFFCCWDFLHSPVAVISIWLVDGSKAKTITEEKYKAGVAVEHICEEKPMPDDFSCLCTFYGSAGSGFSCNVDFIAPFYLTNVGGGMQVSSYYPFDRLYALKPKNPV